MKIFISDDNTIIKLIETAQDKRMITYSNQDANFQDRKIIDDMIMNDAILREKAKEKIIHLDQCPNSKYLWFNSIVIYDPFAGFISVFLKIIKHIHQKTDLNCVFFFDMWPILIAIFPCDEIEIFYDHERIEICKVLDIITLGISEFHRDSSQILT